MKQRSELNLAVYGTRPEEIKLYPFTKYKGFKFLQVDQSKDLHQDLINPDYWCTEDILEQEIRAINPDMVMVQGDTRTAFRAALFAFEQGIPVIHVEAGLRTWDLTQPFPEEGYRQMVDCIATYKFCSTKQAAKNCDGIFVGQTGIDTLMEFCGTVRDAGYWIITIHRREADMPKIIKQLKEHSKTKKLIIYAHPNPQGQELKKYFETRQPELYKTFVQRLANCTGVITDSGGLVEEALALGKKVIQLREKTERPLTDEYKPGATERIMQWLQAL